MILSLLKYLGGYLKVELQGYAPERFLNLCSNHNILIWNLTKCGECCHFYVSVKAFRQMKPFLGKTKTKIRILKKEGFPFWLHRYRKRKLFFAGIGCALFLIWLMSQFIWNIEIRGNSSVTDETVLAFLKEHKTGYGEWKQSIDCEEIEKELRKEFSGIIWASAQISGTKMTIDIKENLVHKTQEEDMEYEVSDLVADKKAVVDSMITRNGTPCVAIGDEVEPGTVLISGRIDIMNDAGEVSGYRYCNADADVYLITEYEYLDEIPIRHAVHEKTGQEKKVYELELFGHKITCGFGRIEFPQYEKVTDYRPLKLNENFYLPAGFYKNTYEEYVVKQENYSKEELKTLALEKLNRYLADLEEKNIQILEKNVIIEIDDKFCRAHGTVKVREKASQRCETERIILPAEDERLVTDELE